ncbi:hypothetical protein CHCC15381_2565 [Bacillus paralicheniformis]|uniref:Uncharacterized protein n=1 Tax=Bacillus paralicheniformis TaxID=1648923 RepID=A0ABY3G1B8_9BACI|nr:hypothetical protein CHCC15381_2565 [Bacillus paralicheniformis]
MLSSLSKRNDYALLYTILKPCQQKKLPVPHCRNKEASNAN